VTAEIYSCFLGKEKLFADNAVFGSTVENCKKKKLKN